MRILDRLPRQPGFAALCGVLMVLPTMRAGLFMDDVLMRVKLLGVTSPWSPAPWWDLYTFGRPDLNPGLLAAGHHPWWADPDMTMTFFRPLAAATHVLDYALWPDSPALQHLHSALWYGLGVWIAALLFRRLHEGRARAAAVAALAFAVAAPHAMAVGWLAGRNTLMAFAASGLMLWAHTRWRREGRVGFGVVAVGLLVAGLGVSEAMLGGLAYVAAWQACMDTGSWRARLAALVPYGVVVVAWRVLHVLGGFGSKGTSIYHDPVTDLPDFVRAVAMHLPVLMAGRWAPAPLDFWSLVPPSSHALVALGALAWVVLVGAVVWPPLRGSALARFWALGMVGALIPFCATVPMDRLVLFAGLGSAGLLGLLAEATIERRWARWARALLLTMHLPLAAMLGLVRGGTLDMNMDANTRGLAQAPRDAAVPGQTFVYVASTFHRVHYTTLMRRAAGDDAVPRRVVVLTSMMTPSTVTREDADTLEVVPEGGYMALGLDRIHRRLARPFHAGDTVELPDVTVEVREVTDDGRPARAAFHFKTPLEDPSLRWLTVTPDREAVPLPRFETRAFTLPAVGETVRMDGGL